VSQHDHLCTVKEGKPEPFKSLLGLIQAAVSASNPRQWHGSASSSSAIPSQNNGNTGGTRGNSQAGGGSVPIPRKPLPMSQQVINTIVAMPQTHRLFILFAVKGSRRTPELAQIDTTIYTNDGAFFEHMRERYRELRGFLRYWFSVWQFNHCDFVKVQQYRESLPSRSATNYL